MPNQSLPLPEESSAIPGPGGCAHTDPSPDGRQKKAAILIGSVWAVVLAVHAINGWWLVLGFAGVLAIYALRLVAAPPLAVAPNGGDLPSISLIVSAQNEESVVEQLAANLCQLDYPADRYEVWVIDDRSTDRTPELLDGLAERYPQLRVLHRTSGGGGKSGALNQVLPLTNGEFIGVFDADAQVAKDCLRYIPAYFTDARDGALQLRKSILNQDTNWLTVGQSIEMSLDAYLQQQRVAVGGLGELRGNGQFVRRTALQDCGGWNEDTITDDLDLTFRLHLNGWNIAVCTFPTAGEEGVTSLSALWPQRSRWAEGGFQRYLDYWKPILQGQAGTKTWDLIIFAIMQYLLPAAALPDLVGAAIYQHAPLLLPLTLLGLSIQLWGVIFGSRRVDPQIDGSTLVRYLILETGYLLHWIVVIPVVTLRMVLRSKQLKWVKTPRQGDLLS
jgi:1,2-diacylglycerol 3-beta-glucosyltransferase